MTLHLLATDKDRLGHVLGAIALIETLLKEPQRDAIRQAALERCFQIIGEACRHISMTVREAYPEIPWASIVGLRNIVTHEYENTDIHTLWEIAEHKIPALKDWIQGILKQHGAEAV